MIYVSMQDYSALELVTLCVEGQSYVISEHLPLPYPVKLALSKKEPVISADAIRCRAWWNAQFVDNPIAIQDTIDANNWLAYHGLPPIADDTELYTLGIPTPPAHVQAYMHMEAYLCETGRPTDLRSQAAGLEAISRAVQWLTNEYIGIPPAIEAFYGYGVDTINKVRKDLEPWTRHRLERWQTPGLRALWQRLELAAKIAMDSIGPVTVDIAGGCYALEFRAVQVQPGVPSLRIAFPCGSALHYTNALLKGHELVDSRGKVLSATRLAKHVINRAALEHVRGEWYKGFTGVEPPKWAQFK